MTDLHLLSMADGAGDWRGKEAKDLSDLVQNRITYLQVRKLLSLPIPIPPIFSSVPSLSLSPLSQILKRAKSLLKVNELHSTQMLL